MSSSGSRPHDWKEWRRMRALALARQGWKQHDIAAALDASETAVSRWLAAARRGGPETLRSHPAPGPVAKLTPEQLGLISRKKARERCVGLSAISSLLQKGDSRVMSLGHPSYPRPKGTRNHSMAEKRGYVEIGETGPRKTRVAWSKLDRLNPNPDRGLSYSVVRPIEHDVIECRPFPFRGYGKPAR